MTARARNRIIQFLKIIIRDNWSPNVSDSEIIYRSKI
jgi:hypothetical protein